MGIEGTILVSTDNGMTWAPHGAGTASYLFGVSVNGASSVGVGGQGTVVMSVNGGAGWGLTVISSQTTVFYGTSFVNAQTGWLVGSTVSPGNVIAKSSNAGFSWSGQTAPTTEQLFGVSFTSVDTGTAVGGGGTIIHTNNGGTTWENQTSPTTQILHGVSFVNSNLGITVGDLGTILRTTNGGLTGISINSSVPSGFGLSQNFPNPFNPSTAISFSVAKSSFVKIVIYDATGRRIAEPVNQQLNAGSYQFQWNAAGLGSGIYFYKMVAGDFSDTKKMILVK